MTNEEAMQNLKDFKAPRLGKDGTENDNLAKAIKIAITALKRLTPVKPRYEGDGYADGELVYDTWICPTCGEQYEVDYDIYKHCPQCGQAVILEEEEEDGWLFGEN